MTDGGHVTGIVTDRDVVIRAAAEGRDLAATTLGSISSSPVLSVDREAPIDDVVRLVRDRAVRRIVVTESGDRPVGVVSLGDLGPPARSGLGAGRHHGGAADGVTSERVPPAA